MKNKRTLWIAIILCALVLIIFVAKFSSRLHQKSEPSLGSVDVPVMVDYATTLDGQIAKCLADGGTVYVVGVDNGEKNPLIDKATDLNNLKCQKSSFPGFSRSIVPLIK